MTADTTEQPERPTDQEILDHIKTIQQEEGITNAAFVSEKMNFDGLRAEYATGLQVFRDKIEHIASTCSAMRTARKDGNCFYRAMSFRYCELLWEKAGTPWAEAVWKRAEASTEFVKTGGYDWTIIEDFWDVLKEAMTKKDDPAKLLEDFQNGYTSDGIVTWLRIAVAAYLRANREIYEAFILDSYPTLDEFIKDQVDPINVEADQIQITAMANLLGVRIKVANLDPTSTPDGINYHDMEPMDPLPVDDQTSIVLLYRPGHYDVLYPNA
ncbi:hypothetical protein HK097_010009 [Rhizophlyctis rosea]|uniref:ubiquitinyl hydrolase 1 n=1 Tax=Rhizophlyctis rosea TaxID=64517 RepID=A0AAD5SHK5_9FUNG|nr:hypothetical protein HK097_010009 [Rhizophlyctis rosea]